MKSDPWWVYAILIIAALGAAMSLVGRAGQALGWW